MNPLWRERIITVIAAISAVWLAFDLADGAVFMPLAIASLALLAIFTRLTGVNIDALTLGCLWFGYIVGNRGFAQLMLVPGLPLLPAEIGETIALAGLLWRCARDKQMPWRGDTLNYALLCWIIVGTARFAFDVPRFGFVAVRDFAMVYYVGFFFVAQRMGEVVHVRQFLFRTVLVTSAVFPFVLALTEFFPDFFLSTLTVHGVPIIFHKGDIAPAFLATCSILLFLCAPERYHRWAGFLATLMLIRVFAGDNRASTLGAVVGLFWIAISRFRRFAFLQVALAGFGVVALVAFATFFESPWASQKARGIAERAISVVDLNGRFQYSMDESISKSGNNQFRWVWWKAVAGETLAENPALGLGFGYDLARGFLQEYTEIAQDFTTRSPHNILVTTFGRMGFLGAGIFVWLVLILARRTWRIARDPQGDPAHVALWAALWPILITAHLGVVLEGPMGAVIFWSTLGLANSYPVTNEPTGPAIDGAEPVGADQSAQPVASVLPTGGEEVVSGAQPT